MTQDYTKSHRITVPNWYANKRKSKHWVTLLKKALTGKICLKHSCERTPTGWSDDLICHRCFEEQKQEWRRECDKNE